MLGWFSEAVSTQAGASDAPAPSSKFFNLEWLIVICALTLGFIAVGSAGLIALNLHARVVSENERALSNSARIIAKQIEQAFAAAEAVQKHLADDIANTPGINKKTFDQLLGSYDVHLKLIDKAAGVPYVGALVIYDADGKLINLSRQWPRPDINIAD